MRSYKIQDDELGRTSSTHSREEMHTEFAPCTVRRIVTPSLLFEHAGLMLGYSFRCITHVYLLWSVLLQ